MDRASLLQPMVTPSLQRWLLALLLAAAGLGVLVWLAQPEPASEELGETGMSEEYERKLLQEIGYLK